MTPREEQLNLELRDRLAAQKQHFPSADHLRVAFEKSREAMAAEARRHFPDAEVLNAGPDLNERSSSWSAIIKVGTDDNKQALQGNDLLMQRLRGVAITGGFAPRELQVESVETVQRDYQGNWFLRWKA